MHYKESRLYHQSGWRPILQIGADSSQPHWASDSATSELYLPPLLPWVAGMLLGIYSSENGVVEPHFCLYVLIVATAFLVVRRVRLKLYIPLAFLVAFGAGGKMYHRAVYEVPSDHILNYVAEDKNLARVKGKVLGNPRESNQGYEPFNPWLFKQQRTSFLLQVESVEIASGFQSASGKLRVVVKEFGLDIQDGDSVEVFGWLYRSRPPDNPGQYDWAKYNARRGIHVHMACDHAANVRIHSGNVRTFSKYISGIRNNLRKALFGDFQNEDHATMLIAMVLGQRSELDRRIEDMFVATGCIHYLAVSGFHVGALAFTFWFPLRFAGFNRRCANVVIVIVVIAYAILADPRPPIVRAAIMTCAVCCALLFDRRGATINFLCLAALIVLVKNPTALFDVGFQLSFITVTGIVLLTPLVGSALVKAGSSLVRLRFNSPFTENDVDMIAEVISKNEGNRWWQGVLDKLLMIFAVSLTAWLCSLPVVAFHFQRIALWGWLNSFLIFFLVYPIIVMALTKAVACSILSTLACVPGFLLSVAAAWLVGLVQLLNLLPWTSVSVCSPPWWLCLLYYGDLLLLVGWFRSVVSRKTVVYGFVLLAFLSGLWIFEPRTSNKVRITQLSVGRGLTTVIELPDGQVWLYDAGASGTYDPGENIIVPFLKNRHIRKLAGIIISHANLDHYGGVPSVLDAVDCPVVYMPRHMVKFVRPGTATAALLDAIHTRNVMISPVDTATTLPFAAPVNVRILWPEPTLPEHVEVNDTSIVMILEYLGLSVLFTGDIGSFPQRTLTSSSEIACDVVMLPHHGARVPETKSFLNATRSKYLVRSTFVTEPDEGGLERLVPGAVLFNTAEVGAVEVLIDSNGIAIKGYRDSCVL